MRYLIAQQWPNLEGNHAGYPHICKLLQEAYPHKYKYIELEAPVAYEHSCKINFIKRILFQVDKAINRRYYYHYLKQKCGIMLRSLSPNDEVFLLEYNVDQTPQYDFANFIKREYHGVRVYAMTHLTPSYLKQHHIDTKKMLTQNRPVDINITLGSSLSNYFKEIGIPSNKISTGFHAVDANYYKIDKISVNKQFTIIAIGALQRNFTLLSQIVKQIKDVRWIICVGRKKVESFFSDCDNVELKGYIPEYELKSLMEESDFSLNVMDDTIGSNVITTSLAMGLGLFVSDVGSIRDYCDESNSIFCNNTVESFVNAINSIKNNKDLIIGMRNNALEKSKSLSIENTDRWFDTLFTK